MTPQGLNYQMYQAILEKQGEETAVSRCRSAYVSCILARDFGETVDAYHARSERARELHQFLTDHA